MRYRTSLTRTILKTYPEYVDEIKPLAIKRKEALSADIINLNKISGNGHRTIVMRSA